MNYKDNFHAVVEDRAKLTNEYADLQTENLRLREAIKAAMREIVSEDFDEAYHQLYAALDPKFENLFGVDIEKAV